jgi:signal transduction histidine kinase
MRRHGGSSLAAAPVAEGGAGPGTDVAPVARHYGRLYRKYLVLILSLVSGALLVSGAISIYFSYQEQQTALGNLQQEKAVAAASRIEQYIRQIERQLAYAALPQLDPSDVELRRIEFLKLLRQVPEVTDIFAIDAEGREQIAVSRLGMDVVGSGKDRSAEPAVRLPKRGTPWFGPVYFKKETEPYMTVGVRSTGDRGPVTVAELNLKFIWDVVSRIKVGERGKAYVVDRNGFLVADPDIGLVLRKTQLSDLAHVKAALSKEGHDEAALRSHDLAATPVLAAWAPIESLDWMVFVEQPVAEVYAKLNASIARTGLLLLAGLIVSAIVALMLARGMVSPIRTLSEGARRIGEGDLDQRIEVKTGDELEALADRFNRMSGQLKESYAGLERKVDERTHELRNSLEQQTAISEILRVISSSPTDVQPVLDAVAERAARLCNTPFARVLLIEGNVLKPVASYTPGNSGYADVTTPVPLDRSSLTGRAAVDRATVHIDDVVPLLDTEFSGARENMLRQGCRAVLAVPLMREGGAYGGIFLYRRTPGLFPPDQVALVETFARQAAIAIDNVRLFNQTKEGLEQQTAISEILRVISNSPTDVQPVLDTVAERATRLCDATHARIFLIDGAMQRPVAEFSVEGEEPPPRALPIGLTRGSFVGRAALDRQTVQYDDVVPLLEGEFFEARENAQRMGIRAVLAVPLVREGGAYGSVLLFRREPRAFSPDQVALVETFARQAAIAIDNTRLFNQTREALARQTAIGDILRVTAGSPTNAAPVLSAVAERAATLCDAPYALVFLVEGAHLVPKAAHGAVEPGHLEALQPVPLRRDTVNGRAIVDREAVRIDDVVPLLDSEFPGAREYQEGMGFRSVLSIPVMREGRPTGTLFLARREPRGFSDEQVGLVQTFAHQLAIALDNVRLFGETKEALDQQRASGEVLAAISSSISDTAPVFETILASCERLFGGKTAAIDLVGEDGLAHVGAYHGPGLDALDSVYPHPVDMRSATGTAILTRNIVHYADPEDAPPTARAAFEVMGIKAAIGAPMLSEGKGIGAIWVTRDRAGRFSDKEITLLKTFADQAVIAIQNARLFREIADKSKQLEIANQHKSAFLASMSHELRTPLNAIIGFSEVLLERYFGELNEKQDDYLKDIHSSGKHLLALINEVLDLSKVEAGRMELDRSEFDLTAAVADAMTLIRERAQQHAIALGLDAAPGLGTIHADERKFKQILLNLLSNAVKFTPDGGRIDVRVTRGADGIEVAVCDTGIGIAAEDQSAVFEEFRQVGRDYMSKHEGTGLGLALCKRLVELHGGRIWLERAPGHGSTFIFSLPEVAA